MGASAERYFRRGALPLAVLCPIGPAQAEEDEIATFTKPESISVEDARDKYGHDALRPYGMRDGTAMLFSVDATLRSPMTGS